MADRLIPKTPSLSAMGRRSKKVRSRTTGRSVTQPEGEILPWICCRCNDSRTLTQLFIAAGGSPEHRLGGRRPGRPASHVFPEAEPEPILAAPRGPSHWRMIARAPARLIERIDGEFKLMHYPSGRGFVCGRPAVLSAHEAAAPSAFGHDSEMDRSGR